MVFGIIAGGIFLAIIVFVLCYWQYSRGRIVGMRDEALAWCEAFDNIRIPNWQSLPVDRNGDREQQEEINKFYVQVFRRVVKDVGEELANNRIAALREEWIKLGMFPDGDGVQRP